MVLLEGVWVLSKMSNITFWFPHDFTNVYDMNTLSGTVDDINDYENTLDVNISGRLYTDVDVCYNVHPWVEDNLLQPNGALFFVEDDNVKIINPAGRDDFTANTLTVIGFTDSTNKNAHTLGLVIYSDSSTTVQYDGNLEITFKTGNGEEVELPFLGQEQRTIQTEEEDPFYFVEEFSNPTDTGWNLFFGIPGSLRKKFQSGGGLEATIRYIPDNMEIEFTIDSEKFEENKLIHYFYVNDIGDLFSSNDFTDVVSRHNGFSSEIKDHFSTIKDWASGLAWDGDNIIHADFTSDVTGWTSAIYKHDEFSSTILDSFSGPGDTYRDPPGVYDCAVFGLGYDGTNLLSADFWSGKIYKHSGISAGITQSFSASSYLYAGAGYNYGLAWDTKENNLLSSNGFCNTPIQTIIFKHNGFSSTILDSFSSPSGGKDIAFDGTNLLSVRSLSGSGTIYKHRGFTTTIIDSFNSPKRPVGLAWG